jgi:uncharacterized protein involved in exopolysaccharide biosynthesis
MKYTRLLLLLTLILSPSLFATAQTKIKTAPVKTPTAQAVKSSPAYAEILLRKTELAAELENYLADYTDEFPKVKELRFELDLLSKEMNRILAVNAADSAKLTLALGKLMLRKIQLETDVWNLRKQYNDEHPDVKQAKRKVEVFEAAIKEIL